MKKDRIHMIEHRIYGIGNPVFVLRAILETNDYEVEIFVDGVKREFETLPSLTINGIHFECKIEKTSKVIETYLIIDDKRELLCTNKNSVYTRIFSKVRKYFEKITNFIFGILKKIRKLVYLGYKAIRLLWREHHFIVSPTVMKKYYADLKYKLNTLDADYYDPGTQQEYIKWLDENKSVEVVEEFAYNPLISILIPVYNIKRKYLSECIESILSQTYKNFEVCLVDDCSTLQETKETLEYYAAKDDRIKVKFRSENGHISQATNDALEMAKGEFVALMDNDDLLTNNALYENVKVLNNNKELDLIYSDEDKIDINGVRRDPHFKADFSPDTLLSHNYICHFAVLRKSIMIEIGGEEVGLEGAQDFDLFLKFTEKTNKIHHIDKILYHWRMIPGSTAATIDSKSYALEKGVKSIENAMKRRGISAKVSVHKDVPCYKVEYLYSEEPSITIIIPTKDYADVLEDCLVSIYKHTKYSNYEIIVVNNDSVNNETFELFEKYKKMHKNFRVIDANFEFNYSKLNNLAANEAKGDYLVLLNNDTTVISEDWLSQMVGYAMQDHIGAVGPKLLYPDGTVQHGGVVMGVGGIANHAFLEADRFNPGLYARLSVAHNYAAVTAACLMVSKEKFFEVGCLDENLMVAYNDIDFNLRLLEKGYYNVFVPQVELYHHESKSRGLDTTKEKYQRYLKEQYYMNHKWESIIKRDPFYNSNFSKKISFKLDVRRNES